MGRLDGALIDQVGPRTTRTYVRGLLLPTCESQSRLRRVTMPFAFR